MRIACSEADIRTSTLQLLSQEINETTHLKRLSCFQVLICTVPYKQTGTKEMY